MLKKTPILILCAIALTSQQLSAAPAKQAKQTVTKNVDHSSMDHSQMTHGQLEHSSMTHDQPKQEAIDHSKMDHSQMSMPVSSTGDTRDPHAYADGYEFGALVHSEMGDQNNLLHIIADRFEGAYTHGQSFLTYDWQASYGQAYNKVLVRAEGELSEGQFRDARTEVLWAHAISPFWDSHLGLRYDSGKGTDRGWLAMGVQGLAPYWIYVEATLYVNEQGRTSFRMETEYDILITQKLILQPRVEMNFYSDTDASRGVSSGLSNVEAGARLRYEIVREFAPYIGVEWSGRYGAAANNLSMTGEVAEETRLVGGVHFWF